MKALKCNLYYMSNHAEVMEANKSASKEDGMKWMADNKARFHAA